MDYTNVIIAGCTVVSTAIAISKILGKQFEKIDKQFEKIDKQFEKIDKQFEKIDESLKDIRSDIHQLDKRLTRIEDRLEFSNKVVYVQHEELKEN